MPLNLNVMAGDALVIDDGRIVITYVSRKGSEVKLSVDADRSTSVRMVAKDAHQSPIAKGLSGSKRGSQE